MTEEQELRIMQGLRDGDGLTTPESDEEIRVLWEAIPTPDVQEQSDVRFKQWDVVEVRLSLGTAWLLLGIEMEPGQPSLPDCLLATRRSTPVVTFDSANRTARTRSGRRYSLVGPPGSQHPVVMRHWAHTGHRHNVADNNWTIVTGAALDGARPPQQIGGDHTP
ncbi:MAG: hypothetical protein WCP28_19930 [Actinomycetes bacterium]